MIFPTDKILVALANETQRLASTAPAGEGSTVAAMATALNMLVTRERVDFTAQNELIGQRLADIFAPIANDPSWGPIARDILDSLNGGTPGPVFWAGVEKMITAVSRSQDLTSHIKEELAGALASLEIDSLVSEMTGSSDADTAPEVSLELTRPMLAAYLKARFDDPSLEVTDFSLIAGGFGKQTFMFAVSSAALNGQFVMRRDLAVSLIGNDCHHVAPEARLIQAVRARGFPAPDVVWLDTDHALLPGGDFFVMHRAPGVPGGSVFEAKDAVAENLSQTLATVLARLHALPPIEELGDLTESINVAMWSVPLERCVEQYIEGYYQLYRDGPSLPSPALTRLFEWLRSNRPSLNGSPALLHGDIGFHNFVLDHGVLTAVLDWEHAHLGDPAEDIAYVKNTVGNAFDWDVFMAQYREAGGREISPERLHYFQIWGQTRNICASNLAAARFADGSVRDLKLLMLPHLYVPQFFRAAEALIEEGVAS